MNGTKHGTPTIRAARQAAHAVAVGLVLCLAWFGAAPALADRCQFSDGTTSHGPCMQFENNLGHTSLNFDLWCLQGPTSSTHKIIMRGNDSFTCKVPASWGSTNIGKTIFSGDTENWTFSCQSKEKEKIRLTSVVFDNYGQVTSYNWDTSCHTLP